MIKLHGTIKDSLVPIIEEHLYEIAPHNWIVKYSHLKKEYKLEGYFKDKLDAENNIYQLNQLSKFDLLPKFILTSIKDEDWINSYKKHFKPWNLNNFHWVPIWRKEAYEVPNKHNKLYLDPNMAFGTGDHETTRLCLESMILLDTIIAKPNKDTFIDIGCGSGILALTASQLGFKKICAVDDDEIAIKVAKGNAKLNDIENVRYISSDIGDLKLTKKFRFVVANIQADILKKNAENLIKLIDRKGYLLLSGILSSEIEILDQHFTTSLKKKNFKFNSKKTFKNEWTALQYQLI